ncbi:TspO/MBR family protein [Streptomyces subrutilus]|uniref:Tryptophan-rich sensory protein n=1 Tax=Streptomyces subrutilus TaxID=36818 RepID=A0A5P2UUK0_9ACTN|nr:TspO/MBR family protein [Streptomyces subrutilus]QEU81915.1 tryptophan-rich sensory protein [Streptomyces subrutilus]WSJ28639.1 tryptophan-rich sensory protein [Streptomyces subrutilus]GGZ71745.1 tryptophan-rich sensory protein [Streptomyces subrutilus]
MPSDTTVPLPRRPVPLLLVLLAVSYAVAALGGLAAADAGEVYASLRLPGWAPPGWVFGPVWTVLYGTLAVAAWLVLLRGTAAARRPALVWWAAQLLLNLLWTPLFFGAGAYGWALVDIVLLLAAVVGTVAAFARAHRPAAWLLVPYLLWVAFATALNGAVLVLGG